MPIKRKHFTILPHNYHPYFFLIFIVSVIKYYILQTDQIIL